MGAIHFARRPTGAAASCNRWDEVALGNAMNCIAAITVVARLLATARIGQPQTPMHPHAMVAEASEKGVWSKALSQVAIAALTARSRH